VDALVRPAPENPVRLGVDALFVERERFPRLTCCVARPLASAACSLSGIGYLRLPGRPNEERGSCLRPRDDSVAIRFALPAHSRMLSVTDLALARNRPFALILIRDHASPKMTGNFVVS
jgi:hypothetical protein